MTEKNNTNSGSKYNLSRWIYHWRMSYFYFFVQSVCMTGIIFGGDVVPETVAGFICITAAAALMLWAISTMKLSNLHVLPELKHNSKFVTSGPYRLLRHPMYAAAMLAMIGYIIDEATPLRIVLIIILAIDLYLKILYEESRLLERFPEYRKYMQTTKRIIPFVL